MSAINSSNIAKNLYEIAEREFSKPEVQRIANTLRSSVDQTMGSNLTRRIDSAYQQRLEFWTRSLNVEQQIEEKKTGKSWNFTIGFMKDNVNIAKTEQKHLKDFSIQNQKTIEELRRLGTSNPKKYAEAIAELRKVNNDLSTLVFFLSSPPYIRHTDSEEIDDLRNEFDDQGNISILSDDEELLDHLSPLQNQSNVEKKPTGTTYHTQRIIEEEFLSYVASLRNQGNVEKKPTATDETLKAKRELPVEGAEKHQKSKRPLPQEDAANLKPLGQDLLSKNYLYDYLDPFEQEVLEYEMAREGLPKNERQDFFWVPNEKIRLPQSDEHVTAENTKASTSSYGPFRTSSTEHNERMKQHLEETGTQAYWIGDEQL